MWLREDFKTVRAHVADERFAAPAVGRSPTRRAKRRTKFLIMDGPATNLINAGVPPNGVPPASSKEESSAQTPTKTARKPWGLRWRSSVSFITFGLSGFLNRIHITISLSVCACVLHYMYSCRSR